MQWILFFSEKDRSLKRFYGKLILAVSDRARRAPAHHRDYCCDSTSLVTLPDNDAYHLLKGEAQAVIQTALSIFPHNHLRSTYFIKNNNNGHHEKSFKSFKFKFVAVVWIVVSGMRGHRLRPSCRTAAQPQLIHCNSIRASCRRQRNASWFTRTEQAVNLITTFNNFIIGLRYKCYTHQSTPWTFRPETIYNRKCLHTRSFPRNLF